MTFDRPVSPIHVTVPGSPGDPRNQRAAPPGVVMHYVPALHPDDVTELNGIPVTTPARTLIDCAGEVSQDELREMFAVALAKGLVDIDAVRASRARVAWRPSLVMLDQVIEEFADRSTGVPWPMLDALAKIDRIRTDEKFAQRVYAALCNQGRRRRRGIQLLLACRRRDRRRDPRPRRDYLDWYCSGGEDDPVAADVRDALAPFGWEPCPLDDVWKLQRRQTAE